MSAAKHTPGPWGVGRKLTGFMGQTQRQMTEHVTVETRIKPAGQNGREAEVCVLTAGDEVFGFESNRHPRLSHRISKEEAQANANLIAAAPDLLAALEEARNHIWHLADATGPYAMTLQRLDAALKKARGE